MHVLKIVFFTLMLFLVFPWVPVPAESQTSDALKDYFNQQEPPPSSTPGQSGTGGYQGQPSQGNQSSPPPPDYETPGSRPTTPVHEAPTPVYPSPTPVYQTPPASPQERGYGIREIRPVAEALAGRLRITQDKVMDLMANLEKGMGSDWFQYQMRTRKVRGVFVYEAGKGGLLVTYMEGDGLVTFAGDRRMVPISLKSLSIGAQIGGEAIWGVGLVMDLKNIRDFGGDYDGKMQSATAADSTTYNWVVMRNNRTWHEVFLLQSGRGLNAGVAAERLTISPRW